MKTLHKSRLSNEILSQLIEKVKIRECLWNPDHCNYNDRCHMLTAWKEISKSLNLKEDIVKAKWRNLRELFIRQSRKYHVKIIEDYKGKWRHYRSMWFIHKPWVFRSITDVNDETQNDLNGEYIIEDTIEEVNENFIKFETPDSPERSDRETDVFDETVDPIPEKRTRYNDDDYDVMYLKSLTPYFRQLDPIRKLVVRSKIEAMLLNEIVGQDTSKNFYSSEKS